MNKLKIKDLIIGEGRPKIAVSITGKTKEEIVDIAKNIDKEKVDLVEWRVDFFKDVWDIRKILESLKSIKEILLDTPLIFTFRSKKEGGEKTIPIDYYIEMNKAVSKSHLPDLIDIEVFSDPKKIKDLIEAIQKENIFVIGSNHNFLKTPSEKEMINILKSIEKLDVDILKLAVMANTPGDVLKLLNITNEIKEDVEKPLITMSMGKVGTISRISGEVFGSTVTFGSLDKVSAPGQLSLDKLYDTLKIIK